MESVRDHGENPAGKLKGDAKPRFSFAILSLVLFVVVFATFLVTLISPQTFRGVARLRIEPDHADIASLGESKGETAYSAYSPQFVLTEMEVIRSEVILGQVIRDLNLNRAWGRKYGDGNNLKTSETLALLKASLELRGVANLSLIDIRVVREDPQDAAKLANAIAEAYRDYRQRSRVAKISAGIAELESARAENTVKIREIRTQISQLSPGASGESSARLDDAKQSLADWLRVDETLGTRIAAERTNLRLPATGMVEILDRATPSGRAVGPNMALNMWVGVFAGSLAGVFLGAIPLLVRRWTRPPETPLSPRLRAGVHVFVALVAGLIIGCQCAVAKDVTSYFFTLLTLVVAAIPCIWIERLDATTRDPQNGARPALAGSSA